ncbi:MAG: cobyrinate a,c-diamide synthase, partial [Ornithinimicrobium sp.]
MKVCGAGDSLGLPRILIAAPASGQGKTTIAVGIMAALTRRGYAVAPAKVGPDYIDPGYHALATGRPGRNLDPWMVDEADVVPLFAHGFTTPVPADVAIIEGAMGLFDGRLGTDGFASSAHLARLTRTPVVVVVDISSASRTVAATIHGLRTFDPSITVAGVVLNQAGSTRHSDEVRRAVEAMGMPVLGVLPRDAGISAPSRHLGLVPAAERPDAAATLERLAEQVEHFIDLDAVMALARSAPDLDVAPWSPITALGSGVSADAPSPVVAIAGGRAFTFRYAETEELLRAGGCDVVTFDPASDAGLPAGVAGLYLGGGFPEVHAAALSGNASLRADIREAVHSGLPTVAECAGLLYLCDVVEGQPMVGAVGANAGMHPRLTLGYRQATLAVDSVLGPAGTSVQGHEFHRTRTDPAAAPSPAWHMLDASGEPRADGFALDPAGTGTATLHAAYLHVHWAGNPQLAANFAAAARAFRPGQGSAGA